MRRSALFVVICVVMALAACGGEPASGGTADAVAGETVFEAVAAPACMVCHSLEPDVRLAGPSLASIGADAGSRVAGESAGEYLRTSIVQPGAFVVDGFSNSMPSIYEAQLSAKQLDDLVAYLLSLK